MLWIYEYWIYWRCTYPKIEVTLRTVGSKQSMGTCQGFLKGSCQYKCMKKKCICLKHNVICNSKYHSSLTYSNKFN